MYSMSIKFDPIPRSLISAQICEVQSIFGGSRWALLVNKLVCACNFGLSSMG